MPIPLPFVIGSDPPGTEPGSVIVIGGMNSPFLITRGFGVPSSLPVGGMRHGGAALLTNDVTMVGGLRFGGSGSSPKSFLAALVTAMKSNTSLVNALGGQRVYSTFPGAKAALPYVLIEDYVEGQPGEEIEHNTITLTISVYAATATASRAVGKLVQDAVDTPAMNKNSKRGSMAWTDGREQDSWRQPTMPPVRLPKAAFGVDLYRWQVTYVFNIVPFFQS